MISNTTYKLLAAAVFAALLIAACQKDDIGKSPVNPDKQTSGYLTFDISENAGWSSSMTKSDLPAVKGETYRSEVLLMECDDPNSPLGDVYIYMVEEDIPAEEAVENVITRADGGESTQPNYTYGVFAYQGSYTQDVPKEYDYNATGVVPFPEIQNLGLGADGSYEGDIYAPGSGKWLQFIAYAPYMTLNVTPDPDADPDADSDANPALYEGPNYPYITYTATQSLAQTTDLLFGGRLDDQKKFSPICGDLNTDADGVTPSVSLSLSHILSNIRVKTDSIGSGRITSIALKNIYSKGTFNLENKKVWTLDKSTIAEYSKTAETGSVKCDSLFLLPQALADDAIIEIQVEVTTAGSETMRAITRKYVLTKKLKAFIAEWQPNKRYTYTISTPHEVEVKVTDEVDTTGEYPVKKNLVIMNTGLADAYIRISLDGAWMVDDNTSGTLKQLMVSEWKNTGIDDTDDGTFSWPSAGQPLELETNSNNWRLGPDGYYYYMKKTVPGEQLLPLFDTYTLTAKAPILGAYLEFNVLAQAFYVDDIKDAFPSVIFDNLIN